MEYISETKLKRDKEINIDIYGEIGNSDNNKIYPKGLKKGNNIYPKVGVAFMKAKISLEEKHHFYISEAELQMHQPWTPLWAKHEVFVSGGMEYCACSIMHTFCLMSNISLFLVNLLARNTFNQ